MQSLLADRAVVGSLYVAVGNSKIYVYAPGAAMPKFVITNGLAQPTDLLFDNKKNLFVSNLGPGGPHSSVTVYANGKGNPVRTITNGVFQPLTQSLAVTADGTLIVADSVGISEYHPASNAPFLKIATNAGNVILTSQTTFDFISQTSVVQNMTIGKRNPNFTISNQLSSPVYLAVDSAGVLYVANSCGITSGCYVTEYAPNGRGPIHFLGEDGPFYLVIDRQQNLYVLNFGEFGPSLNEYRKDHTTPFRTITQGLSFPNAMAVDAAGTLYVANDSPATVTEYAPGQTTPKLTIRIPYGDRPSAMVIAPLGI
jgi:hypothetical protein